MNLVKNLTQNHQQQLVSVIMPVYNAKNFVGEAIESVLCQTYENFEFIIIDDGSTDDSVKIIQAYERRDNRIKLILQKNAGNAAASNAGLEMAASKIVARMDADDIMMPQRLEKQVTFLEAHPEATVVSCYSYHINNSGEIIGKGGNYSAIQTIEECKKHVQKGGIVYCLQPGATFRKGPVMEVGGYDARLPVASDVDLWNRLADRNYFTTVVPERLMKYRIHGDAITSSSFMKKRDYINWMFTNLKRRRDKLEEMSFEAFKEEKRKKPMFEHLYDLRNYYGAFFDRNSALMYGEKKYFSFILSISACLILNPKTVFTRAKNHLLPY